MPLRRVVDEPVDDWRAGFFEVLARLSVAKLQAPQFFQFGVEFLNGEARCALQVRVNDQSTNPHLISAGFASTFADMGAFVPPLKLQWGQHKTKKLVFGTPL